MTEYLPEGSRIATNENRSALMSEGSLLSAKAEGRILEAPCVICDAAHDLIVDMGNIKGVIPRCEGALGIAEGTTRDIALISRVNKPVCFKVLDIRQNGGRTVAILSRRSAQQEAMEKYVSKLVNGDIIPARVTHSEQFGSFVDIACGIPSLIPIDAISVSRITHPSDRFCVGQDIFAAVKGRDGEKICLTHKELLGTWTENASLFSAGETVSGIVRSVEEYGIFVELTPNLAGLAELREGVRAGDTASVYIKAVIPEKMKIKLIIVGVSNESCIGKQPQRLRYYMTSGRMDKWVYSAENCGKYIATDFTRLQPINTPS